MYARLISGSLFFSSDAGRIRKGTLYLNDGAFFSASDLTIISVKACKEKVKPQMGLAARKFGRRWGERSAAQISHHKVPA